MKIFNNTLKAIILCAAITAVSCNKESSYGLENKEGLKNVKEKIIATHGTDKKVYQLNITAADHLSLDWGSSEIRFVENGKNMTQRFTLVPVEKLHDPKPTTIQSEFSLKDKQGSLSVQHFDFDQIDTKVKEAFNIVPKEFDNLTLHSFTYTVDNDNKISADFVIEGKKKGESSQMQGKRIVSNYYEFRFGMDNTGKIEMKP